MKGEFDFTFQKNVFDAEKNTVSGYVTDTADKTRALNAVLKTVFGYDEFRNSQKEIIEELLNGHDVLAVMPTGGGKSLCYQIPALLFGGLTVVVSPLIALMRDQIRELDELGIQSAALNSSIERSEYEENIRRIRKGTIKLLYVAPETLSAARIKNLLSSVKVDCLAVDEAHCISQWGHDFRPEYRQLAGIRLLIPNAVCLALTATATAQIRADIKKNLELKNCRQFVSSFNRKNIYLEVRLKHRPFNQLKEFLAGRKNMSGIVYCFSRKQADVLAEKLCASGFNARAYHAGLSDEERTAVQTDFINDAVKIITATVAFGMGINKPNVRFVVHFDLPKTLEQYYQEIGRAGRDGRQAEALLLFSGADIYKMKFFLQKNSVPEEKIEKMISTVSAYAYSETCRRQMLLNYFGEKITKEKTAELQNGNPCCDICFCAANTASGKLKNETAAEENNGEINTTIPAQKIMSCILRTKSKFGAVYISEVLTGSKQKRILENGHDKLSVWGIGTELSRRDWLRLIKLLIDEGFLQKDEEFHSLYITPLGKEKLKERAEVILPFVKTGRVKRKRSSAHCLDLENTETSADSLTNVQSAVAEALKKMRRAVAGKNGVPAYVIFSDKTLLELALKQPASTAELENIFGIGKIKKERYGEIIIETIKNAVRV